MYVDDISFTNNLSTEVSDKSDELYVKTLVNDSLLDPSNRTFAWSYLGPPQDHLVAGTYASEQKCSGWRICC